MRCEKLAVGDIYSLAADGDLILRYGNIVGEGYVIGGTVVPHIVLFIGKRKSCVVSTDVNAAVICYGVKLGVGKTGAVRAAVVYAICCSGNGNNSLSDSEGNGSGLVTESELCGEVAGSIRRAREDNAILLIYYVSLGETEDVGGYGSCEAVTAINEASCGSCESYRACKSTVGAGSGDFRAIKSVNIGRSVFESFLNLVTAAVINVVRVVICACEVNIRARVVVFIERAVGSVTYFAISESDTGSGAACMAYLCLNAAITPVSLCIGIIGGVIVSGSCGSRSAFATHGSVVAVHSNYLEFIRRADIELNEITVIVLIFSAYEASVKY